MSMFALLQAATADGLVHGAQPDSGGVWFLATPVSYTHLTLPTILRV